MTEKALSYNGIRPIPAERSDFYVQNLLKVFRQIDKIKGINNMRGHTHDQTTTGPNGPSDHGDPGDRDDGPGIA